MSTSNAIHYTLNAVRSTLIENSRNFRFKTLALKNKNKIFQIFLSPLIKTTYKQKAKKNGQIFDSKLHTRLIIEGLFFSSARTRSIYETRITKSEYSITLHPSSVVRLPSTGIRGSGELPTMSIDNPTLAHFRHFSSLYTNLHSTTVENSLQIRPFMQNKANFGNVKMNITFDTTSNYKEFDPLGGSKNKANSNPIQSQFKPKQTQFKPISNPIKPNLSKGQK